MERLTNADHIEIGFCSYTGAKNPYIIPLTIGELCSFPTEKYSPREILEEVFARLAAYEDIGFTPEEINAIKRAKHWREVEPITTFEGIPIERAIELVKAEKDGRLVVLPVKAGGDVWTNIAFSGWYLRKDKRPYRARVVYIGLNESEEMGGGLFNVAYCGLHGYMMQFSFADIGKTVFLTHQEAEEALRREADT